MASIAENMAGDHAAAGRLLDRALGVTNDPGEYTAAITFLQASALNALFDGDLDGARSASEEGVRLSREAGDLYSLEMMLLNLASAELITGDLDSSKLLLADALRIAQQIDDRIAQYYLLDALAYHAVRSRAARRAAQLLGAAETIRTGDRRRRGLGHCSPRGIEVRGRSPGRKQVEPRCGDRLGARRTASTGCSSTG
jgi:tetratricopeptide (TPR) repeat protein